METHHKKNMHWAPCFGCFGDGRVLRGPSKRLKRKYKRDLMIFETNTVDGIPPKSPKKNLDICTHCSGSGLIKSKIITKANVTYPNIAIIGGGIGGAALAVACLHRGIPFTMYERDASFDARSQGYGLTLQQASKAIAGLGIFSLDKGITSTKHVVHNPEGKIIGEWGMRRWIQTPISENSKRKNIHISRQSLRSVLLDQLHESEGIKWNHKLINFSEDVCGGIDVSFDVEGVMVNEKADLVVGADGIRSSVRELLISENITPLRYLGCIVILGICPLKSLNGIQSPLLDSATVFQTVNGHERIYMMPYNSETIMWQLSFPMNENEAKALNKKGPSAMKKEALRRLKNWHEPIPEILSSTDESDITGYPVYDRNILDPKLLQDAGNATLIGDAAHPMSPFKGQGANQALLDALNLARSISKKCEAGSNWREVGLRNVLLAEFEANMVGRSTSKVQDSRIAVELLHSDAVLRTGDTPRGRGIKK